MSTREASDERQGTSAGTLGAGNRDRLVVRLASCEGLRPGEIVGLMVSDLVSDGIRIERRFYRRVLDTPKSARRVRVVPLTQDRLVPIFLVTLAIRQQCQTIQFRSAAKMLDSFGMQQGGTQYRRLVAAFQRIFGATIFFGTDTQRERAAVVHRARFSFMSEARIWYSRDADQPTLPGGFQNEIVLSHEFFTELMSHPIPTDMEAAKALSCSPAALDLFTWLSYRCFVAQGWERVPLFGEFGLVNQLGSSGYARPRKFRERLEGWLDWVRSMWPEYPASIDANGTGLWVGRTNAVVTAGVSNTRSTA
jgi:hypothetical protein